MSSAGSNDSRSSASVARVIESPIAAMLFGSGGDAAAAGACAMTAMARPSSSARIFMTLTRRSTWVLPAGGGSHTSLSARGSRRLCGGGAPLFLVAGDQGVDLAGRTELRQLAVDKAHR